MADTTLFDLADRKLAWLDRQQSLLAQNIANADTPGYQAHEMAPFATELARMQFAITPVRTSPLDLPVTQDPSAPALDVAPERAINGNTVPIDRELTKVAATDANQELVSDLYTKYLSLYRTALGR